MHEVARHTLNLKHDKSPCADAPLKVIRKLMMIIFVMEYRRKE